mmetsp:Transcript_7819/g.34821  ORF Transcript_7819/g.34821 Transcript_7819/m.34821 type:complete len:105 (+) Transcript_7819:2478-2792(+)
MLESFASFKCMIVNAFQERLLENQGTDEQSQVQWSGLANSLFEMLTDLSELGRGLGRPVFSVAFGFLLVGFLIGLERHGYRVDTVAKSGFCFVGKVMPKMGLTF